MEQENNNNNNNENVVQEEPNLENNNENVVQEEPNLENENIGQENTETVAEPNNEENAVQPSGKKYNIIIIIIILLLIAVGGAIYYFVSNNSEVTPPKDLNENKENNEESNNSSEESNDNDYLAYQIKDNSINDFDLQFLKLENNNKNIIYSPLSIKYALEMLKEGANGETRKQIERIIGNYSPKKYTNNANMSFANAMFIKDSYKNFIKDTYAKALIDNYNAEVVYDSFNNPTKINNWINEKTFKLINNLLNDISSDDYILVNALAIDMEWVNKLQEENTFWSVGYIHEDYYKSIAALGGDEKGSGEEANYKELEFKDSPKVAAVEIGAVANRYDIVNVMGESNVKQIVGDDYQKWLDNGAENSCYDPEYSDESEKDPDRETFVNNYIKEINTNYNKVDSSTDFSFFVDNSIKVFSKDLKEYSGTTLQYVAIMPTKISLADYIKNLNSSDLNYAISSLKPMAKESFKDGVITEITGYIPMFKFDYKLNLNDDLKSLGITNVFDLNKADFSNLTTEKTAINEALHKSTIEFSNSGIKAAAVTVMEMGGAGDCGYDYIFEIPKDRIEKIDLTFNRPFLFLIIDKNTKEIWFTGSVYQPAEYKSYVNSIKMYIPWEEEN